MLLTARAIGQDRRNDFQDELPNHSTDSQHFPLPLPLCPLCCLASPIVLAFPSPWELTGSLAHCLFICFQDAPVLASKARRCWQRLQGW